MINTQVQLHILMNVFKKHLKWVKDQYDHESLRYLVKGLMMHRGKIKAEIAWVYVLQGSLTYHGMQYQTNESLRLKEHEVNFVSSFDHGLYVLLDKEYLKIAVENYYQRQKLRRIKFIREFLFAPYFLSDKQLMEFSTFIKVKHYSLNKKIYFSNCKHKIKLIYKGSVSMQYPWRRQLYLSILTPGLIIINKPLEK